MTLVTVDQALSGVSNILVVLLVAHVLSPSDFGMFTIVFLVYTLFSVTARALIGATILVHPADIDSRPRSVLGAATIFGLAVGAVCVLAAFGLRSIDAAIADSLILLGVLTPLLLVQDIGRFMAIAAGRPTRALWLDTLWIVLEVLGFGIVIAQGATTLETSVVIWAAAGAVPGLWVYVHWGVPRRSEFSIGWLRERWSFSWRSMVTSIVTEASTLVGFGAIAAVSSAATVGAVRAAWLMTQPGNIVITGSTRSSLADMARVRHDKDALKVHMRRVLGVSMAAGAGTCLVLVVVPDSVGRLVLGRSWDLAEPLLLAAGLQLVLIAARNGTRAVLLSRLEIKLIMVADIAGAFLLVGLSFVGAVVADAQGVIWAGVIAQAVQTVAWWVLVRRRVWRDVATQPEPEEGLVRPDGESPN